MNRKLDGTLRFGSQLFVNPEDSPEILRWRVDFVVNPISPKDLLKKQKTGTGDMA